jgi:hypothetical protein
MTALIMNADATAPIQYQTLFGKTFRKTQPFALIIYDTITRPLLVSGYAHVHESIGVHGHRVHGDIE